MPDRTEQVTRLLRAIERGEARAADELLPLIYEDLRARAGLLLAGERRNHTLQRTALVHEAYLKLVGADVQYQGRLHFFNAAALAMRRTLLKHAKARGRLKRGGGRALVDFGEVDPADPTDSAAEELDWIDLDKALQELERIAPRRHQVVMLRFFSG